MVLFRKSMKLFVFVLCLATLSPAGFAAEVIVTIIEASDEGHDFDLDNDIYRDRLIELFSFTSYHQQDQKRLKLNAKESQTLDIRENYQLKLSQEKETANHVSLRAIIEKKNQEHLNTVVSIRKPGIVFLGGPPSEKGELILIIENVS